MINDYGGEGGGEGVAHLEVDGVGLAGLRKQLAVL
jgi:hypothetical protein